MSYDVVKQGVDPQRVFLLLLKWPLYAFKLLRRGRFATIAQLRRDAYQLNKNASVKRLSRSDSEDFVKGLRSTMGSAKTAIGWAFFLGLVLVTERFVPQLQATLAAVIFAASAIAILVGLSSIARESSSSTSPRKPSSSPYWIVSNIVVGVFFVASTLPFSLPWVLAFFFPRQCLLFFTAWAAFGAVINEVSVLVSYARLMKGAPLVDEVHKKTDGDQQATTLTTTDMINIQIGGRPPIKRRTRKTTEQRIATVSNFSLDDRKDLEDYIISDEGLKWWAAFLVMQAAVSGIAVFLRLFVDTYFTDPVIVSFALIMSMCMLCESFWMTYAAGGRWLHFRQQWRFFQPFAGGRRFAYMQVVAWTMFFSFLLVSLADLKEPSRKAFVILSDKVPEWGHWLVNEQILTFFENLTKTIGLNRLPKGSIALFGMLGELIMLVSLPLFEGPENKNYLLEPEYGSKQELLLDELLKDVVSDEVESSAKLPVERESKEFSPEGESIDPQIKEAVEILKNKRRTPVKSQFSVPLWELAADALRTAWLSPIVLTLVKPEVTLFLTGFVLSKFVHGASFFGLFNIHLPYVFIAMELLYIPTYFGDPRRSGRRRWWSLRGSWVYDELSAYWHMNIIRERELNPREKHIFGYAPHGMFPMGASYLHNTSMWMELFPNIVPFTLTATVTHLVPFLREVTQYNGGVEVSQSSFANALMKFKNVLLVPGGQHEMLLFSDDHNEVPLSSKHKGFIRLALQSAAENPDEVINLVPVYAFGESDMLYNAFPASLSLQRYLVAKLRLNPAFLPVGRFNLAGVPMRVPITFIVGQPIKVPVVPGIPTDEQVDLLACRYYSALGETYDRHKVLQEGFENSRVTFVPPLEAKLSKAEFEAKWKEIGQNSAGALTELKRKKDGIPFAEYAIAILLGNFCLWVPYYFFA